jgi:hypothetical protein
VIPAWSVDRLGRSLQDLVGFLGEVHGTGNLYLHQQAVDTTTPAGRALFQMLGVFAEFERAMIRSRVKAGLAAARAKGVRCRSLCDSPTATSSIRIATTSQARCSEERDSYRLLTLLPATEPKAPAWVCRCPPGLMLPGNFGSPWGSAVHPSRLLGESRHGSLMSTRSAASLPHDRRAARLSDGPSPRH